MTRVFDDDQGTGPVRQSPPGPHLTLTTPRTFAVAVLSGAVVGWFLVSTFDLLEKTVPVTPWTMSLIMVVVAFVAALGSRWVVTRRAEPGGLTGEQGVMALVFGKTMALTGALLAGGHLSYVLTNVGGWNIPMPRERVIWGSVAVVAGALFAFGGWLLEKACSVPDDTDPDPDQG